MVIINLMEGETMKMISIYELRIYKDIKPIVLKYAENNYPLMDTDTIIYDVYKLSIMLSDGLAAILNDRNEIYNTYSGDLLFFSPEEIHHGRILRQGIHKYIEILIPTEYFPHYKAYYSLLNDTQGERTNFISPVLKEREVVLSLAENFVDKIKHPNPDEDIFLFTNLVELLNTCCNLYAKKENNANNQNIPATLQTAVHFIKKEYSENIQISDIAAASNCSSSYLFRLFKKHIGKSPYDYLTEYRLFAAEKLLKNGNTVTDAAIMSGFCDSSVFIKCFKKAFGITPLKYKKTHR